MKKNATIVVTSISGPNEAMQKLANAAALNGYSFIVIGDISSPVDFHIDGCSFYSIEDQKNTGLKFAQLCPTGHYARKNVGYLIAIKNGSKKIVETDDDNLPLKNFLRDRKRINNITVIEDFGWLNVYKYFTDSIIWPRGLPLNKIYCEIPEFDQLPVKIMDCPIQQGLADQNPDVDAIYRLVMQLPKSFRSGRSIALAKNTLSPFNSQNTTWWEDSFPLLYLPAFCTFRMTDIWRSFVAQRIAWENNWAILFHEPTVWQERNEHDLMHDFVQEIPGYLNNERIFDELIRLELQRGEDFIAENLMRCYEKLISLKVIEKQELNLLKAWLEDLKSILFAKN